METDNKQVWESYFYSVYPHIVSEEKILTSDLVFWSPSQTTGRKWALGESMFLTILVLNGKRKEAPITPNSGAHLYYTRNLFS